MSASVWLGSPAAEQLFDIDRLTPTERERYDGLKGERRRREFAVSRALRHAAVGESLDPTSLSHSGGWAAVARAAPGCQLGVDLEFHRPRNLLGIARFAFDPAEVAMLEALAPEAQPGVFYALWTLKESMAKALGLQLLHASHECVFRCADFSDPNAWQGTAPTTRPWMVRVFRPRADMALCVTVIGDSSDSPAFPLVTREWPTGIAGEWQPIVTIASGAP